VEKITTAVQVVSDWPHDSGFECCCDAIRTGAEDGRMLLV